MKRSRALRVVLICVTAVLFRGQIVSAQTSSPDGLGRFIKEALNNNPQVQRAYHQWQAAQYKIDSVSGLPDPSLSYGYFGESIETRVGPQKQKFGVSQKVPFPGKLKYKGEVQRKEAGILKQEYEAARNEVVKNVKTAFYELYWLDRALQINQEEKTILADLENVAQRKYESNLSSQQDIIKLQVELSKIIKKIALLEQSRKSMTARMNKLLNRPRESAVETITEVPQAAFSYGLEDILKEAQSSRQDLIAANLAVEKSEFEKMLARMEYLPDFTLGYEYTDIGSGSTSSVDDGKDAWMGKISVEVPFWLGKIKSDVKAKEEELQAARKEKEDAENQASYEVQDMYFRIMAYKDIVNLYEAALVPQAEQAFDASQTGFETGKVAFLDWLDAERTYLQTRLAYYRTVADYQKSIAILEKVIGKSLGGTYGQ